jgi:hypothetical protein
VAPGHWYFNLHLRMASGVKLIYSHIRCFCSNAVMFMGLQYILLMNSTWSIRNTHRKFRLKEECLSELCTCAQDGLPWQMVVEARSRKQRNPHVHGLLKRAVSCGRTACRA